MEQSEHILGPEEQNPQDWFQSFYQAPTTVQL